MHNTTSFSFVYWFIKCMEIPTSVMDCKYYCLLAEFWHERVYGVRLLLGKACVGLFWRMNWAVATFFLHMGHLVLHCERPSQIPSIFAAWHTQRSFSKSSGNYWSCQSTYQ